METSVLIEKVKAYVDAGNKKSKIESDLGMPANCLASILTGKRDLGRKWVEPIQEYLSKESRAAFDIDSINKQISKINELEPLELAKKQIAELKQSYQKLLEAHEATQTKNKELAQELADLKGKAAKNAQEKANVQNLNSEKKSNYSINTAGTFKPINPNAPMTKRMAEPEKGTNAYFLRYGTWE